MLRSVRRRFLRFGFYLLYNPLAFAYDFVAAAVSLGQWQTWARTALDRVRGPRVLELGHGPGHLLIALARSGRKPIGLDLSPNMIAQAQRHIRRSGLSIPQVCCRVQALPFRSGAFDSVAATFPTEYIAEAATAREVARVTNAHGRLVVVLGAQLGGRGVSSRAIEWLYRITGQHEAPIDAESTVYDQAGLSTRIEVVPVGASEVALLIADKDQAG